jgi:hypothetical protein
MILECKSSNIHLTTAIGDDLGVTNVARTLGYFVGPQGDLVLNAEGSFAWQPGTSYEISIQALEPVEAK